MNKSDYLVGFLNPNTQRAYADSQEVDAPTDKPKPPATPQLALLRRIKKVVFSPSTKTLEQALEKFETIVDSLDDSEDDDAPKPNDTNKE
jgi:hypothetical protein